MGSLILCHKKRAKRPFEISRVHMRIYTIEELCYYICNNLYLIDYTIVNERLCRWIGDELERNCHPNFEDFSGKMVPWKNLYLRF